MQGMGMKAIISSPTYTFLHTYTQTHTHTHASMVTASARKRLADDYKLEDMSSPFSFFVMKNKC